MSRISKIKQDFQDFQDCQDEEDKRLTCYNSCLFICSSGSPDPERVSVNVPQQVSLHLAHLVNREQDYRINTIDRIKGKRG